MSRYKYPLTIDKADQLNGPIMAKLLREISGPKITIEEQCLRLGDIASMITSPAFDKPVSSMTIKRIRKNRNSAIYQIGKIANRLSRELTDDKSEQKKAVIEYRIQLKSALISQIILTKAKEGMIKWEISHKFAIVAAVGIAVGAMAIAILVAHNLRKHEDPNRALKRGQAKAAKKSKVTE